MTTGTTRPPRPAATGSASRARSRSSPRSNSRRASRPKTKKKNVISPLLTHSRRSSDTPVLTSRIDSRAPQTASYDDALMFTQASAATAMPSSTAALPVSVRRNTRSGVCRFRAHAVRPENGCAAAGGPSSDTAFLPRGGRTSPHSAGQQPPTGRAASCPTSGKAMLAAAPARRAAAPAVGGP